MKNFVILIILSFAGIFLSMSGVSAQAPITDLSLHTQGIYKSKSMRLAEIGDSPATNEGMGLFTLYSIL